jgi:hypothetical protein
MRRAIPFLLILATTGAALIGREQTLLRRPAPGGARQPAVVTGLRYQGVGSCAAAACHNANGPPGSRGSEYTTWATRDPHARAYAVLLEPRSQEMVRKYRQSKAARAERDNLCLSCHAVPGFPTVQVHPRFVVQDGVGCEVCHGPAQKWLSVHYLPGWRLKTNAEKRQEGMIPTRDLRVRAAVCVRCHVGTGEMDVNHDLIASGHPRLRFEYGAYLANYPKHWPDYDLHERRGDKDEYPDLEARAWLIGQVASAQSALDLLAYRAAEAAKKGSVKPWPEFAEYNCAACHHGLKEPKAPQPRGFGKGEVGSLVWGTWYYPLLPSLAERTRPGGSKAVEVALETLGSKMRVRLPAQGEVATRAQQAADLLGRWLDRLKVRKADRKLWASLLRGLAGEERLVEDSWDSATQVYLGLAALYNGLGDLDRANRQPRLKEALEALRRQLEGAFPGRGDSLYDSPSGFSPSQAKKRLHAIRMRLE